MVPDRQKVWTDGAKTISLRLCRGIKILVSRIAIRWIPNSLVDGQKRGRVSIARKNASEISSI